MATSQSYGNLTAEQKTFYDRVLLERLLPSLVYADYGQKKSAPKREGDTMNFRRFNALAAVTTPLTEGVTPGGNTLSIATVNATVAQYGDFVQFTDKIDMVGIDPVLTETIQVLGEQAALTIDTVIRDIITAGTTVQYAGGKASRILTTQTDILTGTEIKKAVRTLRRNNAQEVAEGAFIGIIGPDAEFDLMSDAMWVDVAKYQNKEQLYKGEIGKLYGVKFIRTSNAKKFAGLGASGCDIYGTLIIGKNAYGVVDVNGSSKPESIVKAAGSAGTSDPLNQISTAGWKAMFTAVRLQELAMVRIEHAATL
jgi:N4-gp56 family major capsid protein